MWPFDQLRRAQRQIETLTRTVARLEQQTTGLREALGRIESRQLANQPPASLHEAEFRVYSQWGEDGILDYLVRTVAVPRRVFVEFGVEDYTEANSRFLLTQRGWSGLVLDGSAENIKRIHQDAIFWRHHLKATAAFITRENINDLLRTNGLGGPIGLLSVDIDGNDYWVWEAITVVEPAIVVVEYNALFGPERRVTIPYQPKFVRSEAHWSHLYAGASLAALVALGRRKGYSFVGTNRPGNNAFFVRRELRPATLPELTAAQGFTPTQFRESRNKQGQLSFLPADEAARLIAGLPLEEVPE
jgi:hypothetical protein